MAEPSKSWGYVATPGFESFGYFDLVLDGDPVAAARQSLERARGLWSREPADLQEGRA